MDSTEKEAEILLEGVSRECSFFNKEDYEHTALWLNTGEKKERS
jgi:hypothetical protein